MALLYLQLIYKGSLLRTASAVDRGYIVALQYRREWSLSSMIGRKRRAVSKQIPEGLPDKRARDWSSVGFRRWALSRLLLHTQHIKTGTVPNAIRHAPW